MSSEAITRNDLKAILERCGMSGMAFQEAAVLRVTDKVITNTTTAEIKPDSCTVYGNANVLSTDGTYLTINKTCPCIIIKTLGISTTAQPTYIKVFNICERSNPTIPLGVNAAARLNTWETVTASDIITLNENDVISLHGRADDGNITLYNCCAIIIPIDNKIDTVAPIDYIVEQGTTDGWDWRKWNSGRYEAWVSTSATIAISTASGSIYFGNASISISTLEFVSVVYANVEYVGVEGTWTKLNGITTTSITFSFASGMSRTSSARDIRVYVFGTWK